MNLRFFIRCKALGIATVGGGLTKKIAKHTAAEKLLNKHLRPTDYDNDDDDVPQTQDINCITELMDFCVLKDFHKPEFNLVVSCGPSHAPTFTIECKLNSIARKGTAGSKSQAKQLAAKEVLDILKSVFIESLCLVKFHNFFPFQSYPDIEKKVAVISGAAQVKEQIRQKVISYRELKKMDKVDKMGKVIKDRHRFFRTQEQEFVETFCNILKSSELTDSEKYQKVLDELETMWEYKVEKLEGSEMWKFELLIEFDKFTCLLIADTEEALKTEILQYFNEMMNINRQPVDTPQFILKDVIVEAL